MSIFFPEDEGREVPNVDNQPILRTEIIAGAAGPTGSQGPIGPVGVGVVTGGLTGQVLAKKTNADYDTEWVTGGGAGAAIWGGIAGTLSNQTDLQTVLNAKAPSSGISPSAISGTAVITTDSRLSDSRTPTGAASGDLSGTYPSPSVIKLQGFSVATAAPITGQSLGWTGSEWSAVTPLSVVSWGSITGTLSSQTDLQSALDAKAPASGISPSAISGTAVITTDSRLSDSRMPTGAASGDLSGTFPAPEVIKLRGYSVSLTSPSDNQAILFNSSATAFQNSTLTIGTISGLSADLSGKVTAVSGTSPIVSSGGTSPTISIPVATATTNGYLASADWSTFNAKQAAGTYVTSVTGTTPIVSSGGTTPALSIPVATAATNGYLSSTDWSTFNSKQAAGTYVTSVTGTTPIVSSGGTTPALSIPVATATTNGYLSSTDWSTFNAKQTAGAYVTSVTSGITGATQLTNMMQITSAGYSAITSPVANTLYIIVG
jgi:HEPN domain-containing protein